MIAGGTFRTSSRAKTDISVWSIDEIVAGIIAKV
jgi:hypothetical protein